MRLSGRTILLTGGSSGIGLALARQLLARDNAVIVTGRDPARLEAARVALPGLEAIRSDVTDPEQIDALHKQVITRFPALDVLINNAGIMRNLNLAQPRELTDVTCEIDVAFSGPVRIVQQFLPHLLSCPNGLIVNVTSGLAFVPMPASPIYSAAKAALHAYTRSLRLQLASTAVHVVEIAPPPVETTLFRGEFAAETAGEKAMDPAVLAAKAIAAIEAGKEEVRPGVANLLMIASRVAPGFMFGQMAKLGTRSHKAPAGA